MKNVITVIASLFILTGCGFEVETEVLDDVVIGTYLIDFSNTTLYSDSMQNSVKNSRWTFNSDHTYQIVNIPFIDSNYHSGTWKVIVNEDVKVVKVRPKEINSWHELYFSFNDNKTLLVNNSIFNLKIQKNIGVVNLIKSDR